MYESYYDCTSRMQNENTGKCTVEVNMVMMQHACICQIKSNTRLLVKAWQHTAAALSELRYISLTHPSTLLGVKVNKQAINLGQQAACMQSSCAFDIATIARMKA